jgi:hypothetical protein
MDTFIDTAVASDGIDAQFPFEPRTGVANVSPGPIGTLREPTFSEPARVSSSRHGVIGTNEDTAPGPVAVTVTTPPARHHPVITANQRT